MKLWELFDSRGHVRWDKDSLMSTAHFSMGGEDYTVMFWHGRDGTNISFMVAREGQKDDTGLTGSGNSFKVFAQVSQIILEYISQDRPERFDFQGDGASRIKLYDKLSNLLVSKFPQYELEIETLKTGAKSYQFGLKAATTNEDRIDELLNQPLEWEWTRERDHGSIATFYTDEDKFDVALSKGDGYMDVMFLSKNHGLDISGDGKAFQIFATVAAIIKDFIGRNPPQPIRFSAKEPSRSKLYWRLAQMMAKELGWKADSQETSLGRQFYVEPYHDLKEDGKIIPNVNTTIDVKPGETERQAAKFGNKLDAKGRPPLLSGSYGDDTARFSANQGDPFYGSDGTRLPKNPKWS